MEPNSNPSDEPTPPPHEVEAPVEQPWWDTDDAVRGLTMERSVNPTESNADMTKRILDENGPAAALAIVHMALHSTNDNTRLRAATYITDKYYDDSNNADGIGWEKLVGDVVSQAEILTEQAAGHIDAPGD
jgi:hypothetical protein